MALLEGDWNKPFPIPIIPDARIICHIVAFLSYKVNINNAMQYVAGPNRVKILLPYLPDNLPAIGAVIDKVREYGRINKPVISALYFKISCKKNGNKIHCHIRSHYGKIAKCERFYFEH